jgi:Predicted signal transduction protein with a C-terminal ATPase domain
MLVASLPVGSLLIVQNIYAISAMHDKVASSNKGLVSLYMGQIDQSLSYIEYYLNSLAIKNISILSLDKTAVSDENAYQLAKVDIQSELSSSVPLFSFMDAVFVYQSGRDEFVASYNALPPITERELIFASIRRAIGRGIGGLKSSAWSTQEIGGSSYLLRIRKIGDTYIGSWGRADRILLPLALIDLGKDGAAVFVSGSGAPLGHAAWIAERGIDLSQTSDFYYMTGTREKYLVVKSPSSQGPFSLAAIIPDATIRAGLPSLLTLILWLSIVATAMIPLAIFFVRSTVLSPLARMVAAMRSIQEGDLATRLRTTPASTEFAMVDSTFNGMMDRIRDLKIDVYEERLNVQRAELKQLQMQVKPHFFLNTLNVIYHMAQMREYSLIQEMAEALVGYYRYTLRSDSSFVSLGEELEHVRNYQRIQEIRFAGKHSLAIEAPEEALVASVPPLIVQTFVENADKYGIADDGSIAVSVSVELIHSRELLRIRIADRGPGIPQAELDLLNEGKLEPGSDGGRIGIWNIRRRLSILYHGRARLCFHNSNPGAIVEIETPFTE